MTAGFLFITLVGLAWPCWRMWRGDWPDAER